METLVGRSQNVNSIIQRKKKTKKIIIISIAVILITGLLLGINITAIEKRKQRR